MNAINYIIIPAILNLFDGYTNTTGDPGMSVEMKTYYDMELIENAEPELVHAQFGQKKPIPKGKGKTIEFRKYDPLPKALTPLTEGVTPQGQKMSASDITATVKQYGDFIELSDMLILTAIDNNMREAIALLGSQAGRTLDTLTREVLNGGTNVTYADGTKLARFQLVGGEAEGVGPTKNDYFTVDCVRRAVRWLKVMNAKKINGSFVAIIHPDCAYDIKNDKAWEAVKTYCDPDDWYEGEIGRIEGCRFVETTEAKTFYGADLASDSRTLLVNDASLSGKTTVKFDGGDVAAHALKGRMLIIGENLCTVTDNTSSTITIKESITVPDDTVIYPGEGGAKGRTVYSTLFLADHAYGVTEIEGGGLQHISKQLGSAGTSDALNQRATVGWKATHAAERLVEMFLHRVETCSTFDIGAN